MSRRIVVECDRCPLVDRPPAPARAFEGVVLLDGKSRDVDLCDECVKSDEWSLLDWQSFLEGEARPIAQPKRATLPPSQATSGEHECPACDRTFASNQGLATHCARAHDRSLSQLRGEPTPFQCSRCPRAYATADQLRGHLEKASDERHRLSANEDVA